MSTITVGIDGSPESLHALRWAITEARRRGSSVHVVHAWQLPYHQGYLGHLALNRFREPLAEAADHTLTTALIDPTINTEWVSITSTAIHGPPAQVLIDMAANSELLVVGSRGRGGFTGLMLGSVSQQCAQGTPCPIVIVPGRPQGDELETSGNGQ